MTRNKKAIILILTCAALAVVAVFFSRPVTPPEPSPVIITEVCADNLRTAYDDNANYGADYIELYNRSDSPINLKGWAISDSVSALRKFVFPDFTIDPGQAIIAWCSPDIDDTSTYKESYVPVDIHGLPFNLTAGERCILTTDNRKPACEILIPTGIPDGCSYSTSLSSNGEYYISLPTPYYLDETANPYVAPTLDAPSFSVEGGWFSDNIEVELTASEGTIYYTTDGTQPNENSARYEGPITVYNKTEEPNVYTNLENTTKSDNTYLPTYNVDKGTVIKAIAISDNGYSTVSSQTYFVGLNEEDYAGLPIISLTVAPEDFWGYEKGIYVTGKALDLYEKKFDTSKVPWDYVYVTPNYTKEGIGWERDALIEYFSPELQKVYEQNIGIRIHGNWSVAEPQKSFNIYAREEYDGNTYLQYDFLNTGKSYSSLALRGGGTNDMYATKSRDTFNQSRFADRSVGIARFMPCNVFVNGEYWGMYNIQERPSLNYIEQHYGVPESNIILVKDDESKTDYPEDAELFQEVEEYAANNDLSIEKNYRHMEKLIDIQSCIDYYCAEIITANDDSYHKNWAVWRSRNNGLSEYEDCRWRWILCDLDLTDGISYERNEPESDSFVIAGDVSPLIDDTLFPKLMPTKSSSNVL